MAWSHPGESPQQPQQTWRYCGGQIKLWREETGVSRQDLAKETNYDYEYVKSMECGRRRLTLRLLQVADHMCGAKGKLVAAYEHLKPEPFPMRTQQYVWRSKAVGCTVRSGIIPGLLQTEAYARELINVPAGGRGNGRGTDYRASEAPGEVDQ